MIVTTTNSVEGKQISEYLGIVSGENINGVNFIKDIGAGFRNFVGGRSKGYEEEIIRSRKEAVEEAVKRAEDMGADALVGCKIDYEVVGSSMLMVTMSGTAVKFAN